MNLIRRLFVKKDVKVATLRVKGINKGTAFCDTVTLLAGDTLTLTVVVDVDIDGTKVSVKKVSVKKEIDLTMV